jgi:hypothetical protein
LEYPEKLGASVETRLGRVALDAVELAVMGNAEEAPRLDWNGDDVSDLTDLVVSSPDSVELFE